MDYFFITEDSIETRESLARLGYSQDPEGEARLVAAVADRKMVKGLLLKDTKSKMLFAWLVEHKGHDETGYIVDQLTTAIKFLGYNNLLLKSDNEPAILALLRDTLKAIRIDVDAAKEEHPTPYDSLANGSVENGIRNLKGIIRTLRCCLEARIGKRFPVDHPAIA